MRGVARLARITEDSADGVMRRAVERGLLRHQLQSPKLLGFDEPERSGDRPPQAARRVSGANQKAIRKGHRYATILTDVGNGCVIDLVEERTKEAALHLLGQLPEGSTGSVQAAAMDMWPAYIGAVEQALPKAAIVCDKFQIIKHLNEVVDKSGVRNTGNSAPPAITP